MHGLCFNMLSDHKADEMVLSVWQQNLQMEDDDFANVHGQVDRIWSQMLCLMFMAKATQKQCLHMP